MSTAFQSFGFANRATFLSGSKADNDPGEWMPDRNRGWHASTIVKVKQKYDVSVDEAERDALARALSMYMGQDEVDCAESVPALQFLDHWLRGLFR